MSSFKVNYLKFLMKNHQKELVKDTPQTLPLDFLEALTSIVLTFKEDLNESSNQHYFESLYNSIDQYNNFHSQCQFNDMINNVHEDQIVKSIEDIFDCYEQSIRFQENVKGCRDDQYKDDVIDSEFDKVGRDTDSSKAKKKSNEVVKVKEVDNQKSSKSIPDKDKSKQIQKNIKEKMKKLKKKEQKKSKKKAAKVKKVKKGKKQRQGKARTKKHKSTKNQTSNSESDKNSSSSSQSSESRSTSINLSDSRSLPRSLTSSSSSSRNNSSSRSSSKSQSISISRSRSSRSSRSRSRSRSSRSSLSSRSSSVSRSYTSSNSDSRSKSKSPSQQQKKKNKEKLTIKNKNKKKILPQKTPAEQKVLIIAPQQPPLPKKDIQPQKINPPTSNFSLSTIKPQIVHNQSQILNSQYHTKYMPPNQFINPVYAQIHNPYIMQQNPAFSYIPQTNTLYLPQSQTYKQINLQNSLKKK